MHPYKPIKFFVVKHAGCERRLTISLLLMPPGAVKENVLRVREFSNFQVETEDTIYSIFISRSESAPALPVRHPSRAG